MQLGATHLDPHKGSHHRLGAPPPPFDGSPLLSICYYFTPSPEQSTYGICVYHGLSSKAIAALHLHNTKK